MTPPKDPSTEDIGARILELLKARAWTIAFAESLTAGYLAGTLARTSGISAVLRGGIVTYDIPAKAEFLGVDRARAEACEAVSAEVALAMAEGVRRLFKVPVGVSATGFAEAWDGKKPQAYVGFAIEGRGSEALFFDLSATGEREACRQAVVDQALAALCQRLELSEA